MLLGSCAAVGPDFKRPEVPWLIRWPGGSLASLNAEQHGKSRAQTEEWWRNFNDPVLDQLIAELLFKHGNDSELDVQQAKAQYLGTLSTIPQLEGSLRQTQNALATLLARPPGPLPEMTTGKDATRHERLYAEDPAAISVRRLEVAQATRVEAGSKEKAAEADLRKAQEAAGESGDKNAQLRSARAAIEKAELDLARTRVLAPARGLVTDLRTDVGHFAQAGAPAMTLIAIHDLWINADLTENNRGNIDPGDEVAIILDVLPGEVLKGRVRSIGSGVSSGQQAPAGTLPTIQNSRDWLRQAQRFPVALEFDAAELERLRRVRIGGQAEIMVYTGDHVLMNLLGAGYMRLMSWLS